MTQQNLFPAAGEITIEGIDQPAPGAAKALQDPAVCFDDPEDDSRKDPIVKKVNRRVDGAQEPRTGRQGKCMHCRECYRWNSRIPLRLAYCPECGEKLQATTHLNTWPWNEGIEPLTAVQAWAKEKTR